MTTLMTMSAISDETFRSLTAAAPEIRPFWEAARRGKLLLAHCTACDRPHWFPRVVCPLCSSCDIEWREASGRGTVYSVSVARRATPPYALAYVTLDEGPTNRPVNPGTAALSLALRPSGVARGSSGAVTVEEINSTQVTLLLDATLEDGSTVRGRVVLGVDCP